MHRPPKSKTSDAQKLLRWLMREIPARAYDDRSWQIVIHGNGGQIKSELRLFDQHAREETGESLTESG